MQNVALTKKVLGKSRKLVIDGEVLEDSWGSQTKDTKIDAGLAGAAVEKISNLTISTLSEYFGSLTICLPNVEQAPGGWAFTEMAVRMDLPTEQLGVLLQCELQYDFWQWSNSYSIGDLAEMLQKVLNESPESPLKFWTRYEAIEEGFGVKAFATMQDTIKRVLELEKDLNGLTKLLEKKTFEFLFDAPHEPPATEQADNRDDRISILFSFPVSVKSACEQYLLYFGQFLSDLGIQAETGLSENAGKVLFSVTPTDATEALTQIRDALDTYLKLPFMSEFSLSADRLTDPAVAQLKANVLHLKAQLYLAKSILELKDATIEARNTELGILKNALDLRRFSEKAHPKSQSSDSETLIKGVVSVTKYKLKFLEFDFPAILRKLKRLR